MHDKEEEEDKIIRLALNNNLEKGNLDENRYTVSYAMLDNNAFNFTYEISGT